MSEWQPIETAPRDGTIIDLWDGFRVPTCWWNDDYSAFESEAYGIRRSELSQPTHWMPLPKPPEVV